MFDVTTVSNSRTMLTFPLCVPSCPPLDGNPIACPSIDVSLAHPPRHPLDSTAVPSKRVDAQQHRDTA